MSTTVTSRLEGLVASLAQKAPCVLKTTANHALSGLSAIDGVTPTAGQRILVGSQTDATQNGIYVAASGAWARAADFDGTYDAVGGTQVSVILGSTNSNSYWKVDGSSAITIGTDSITFSAALIDDSATAAFIASGAGAVARTVQAKLRDMPTPQDFGVSLESTSQGIGTDVLQLVTTGTRNTAFGYRALGPCSGAWLRIADLATRPEILEEALRQGALERSLLARSASLMHDGAEARLAGLLLRYAQAVGRREASGVRILAKRSQQELGAACGLTLRHTNRVLGRWKRLGIVHKDAGHLVVNLEALSAGAALATPIFERRYSASAQA